jgi:hypothetical protein
VPAALLTVIGQATPELVGALLREHPELAQPILAATQAIHGNAFAMAAVQQPLRKTPPPDAAPEAAPAPAQEARRVAQPAPIDPARQKIIDRQKTAAWDQLAAGVQPETATPTDVRLPPNIVSELERAWKDTLATKVAHEQGGNLVKNYSGGYGIRRRKNDNANLFDQDDRDVGTLQTLVAQVHTHPYREEKDKVPEQYASFSDGDFDSLMRSDAHMSLLRSGPYTFLLAKTKQFQKLVAQTNNDEDKLADLARRMTRCYDAAADRTEGSFSQQVEAGVLAVCEAFHLVYYSGQGADLTRKSKRPGT